MISEKKMERLLALSERKNWKWSAKKNGKIISVERKKKLKFKQNIILIISKVWRKVKKSCKGKEKVKSILKLKKSKIVWKSQKVILIYVCRY